MPRRSTAGPAPALRVAVRAGAAGAIAAAVAVPLLRRRLRTPAAVTVAACAAGPLALAVLKPRSHRRDVALFALQMWAFTMAHELPYDDPAGLRRRLLTRYPITLDRAIGLGSLPNVRLQRALARLHADRGRQPLPHLGPLALVPRALPGAALHPAAPPGALPARRPADGRRLRPRLRRLLPGADGAALVVVGAGPDRRGGAADHGRGGGGDLGLGLAGAVRGAGRQPLGGDAVAALRHLDDGGDFAERSGAGAGRRGMGLRTDARLLAGLSGRALRHRSGRGRARWWRRCGGASRSPSRSS